MLVHMLKSSEISGSRAGEFGSKTSNPLLRVLCFKICCGQWNVHHPLSEAVLPGLRKCCVLQDLGGQHSQMGWGGVGRVCSVCR